MPIVHTGSKQTYYSEWKPDRDASTSGTVISAHGLGATNNFWTALIPHLTSAGYRCIAYDLHGCGLSPYGFIEQSIPKLAEDVIHLMDALDIKNAVFAGHSMSVITGPHLAANYPDRITGLALCAPVYPTDQASAVFDDRIDKITRSGSMETLANFIPSAATGSKAGPLQKGFIRDLILRNFPPAYISLCRVMSGAWLDLPKYEKVSCPVLIVAGSEDKDPSVKMCETIRDRLGCNCKQIKVLEGVGHWTAIEAAEETGVAIRDFLELVQKDMPKI